MLSEEPHHLGSRLNPIRNLAEAVSLIRKKDVFDGYTSRLQIADDLLRLDYWNVGIVSPVLNHGCSFDTVELVDRGEFVEHIFLCGWIAVLDGGDGGHPRLSVLEECHEVRDAE